MILRKNAKLYQDNVAVVYEGRRLTYGELYKRSCRLAHALLDLGLKPGDRVATLEDNVFESPERMCAFALAGLVRCPMYTQNVADVHLYMLNLTEAKALIVEDRHYKDFEERIGEARALAHVIVQGAHFENTLNYEDLLDNAPDVDPNVPVGENDIHIVRFSAGTTGRPKGIVHSTRGFLQMSNEFMLVVPRFEEEDVALIAAPLSHAGFVLFWPVIAHGGRIVLMPAFDPGRFLELIEQEHCTVTLLVPTMIQMIVNHPEATSRDLASLRTVLYGTAPIAEPTLLEAQNLWGNIMYQVYGQSEAAPITVLSPRHHLPKGSERERHWLRSAGRPTPNSFVKILDEEGNEVSTGEMGEITVRTPGAMKEIWNDPEPTAERMNPEGWVRTRDVGYLDEDGFLYIADRKEDMIISGGFNIWPTEIENALLAHAAVLEAAVIGVPHEKWGETPKAVVVLREGQSATEQELIDWCRAKVGGTKKPTSIEFSEKPLPKSPVGKVLRRVVRESFVKV